VRASGTLEVQFRSHGPTQGIRVGPLEQHDVDMVGVDCPTRSPAAMSIQRLSHVRSPSRSRRPATRSSLITSCVPSPVGSAVRGCVCGARQSPRDVCDTQRRWVGSRGGPSDCGGARSGGDGAQDRVCRRAPGLLRAAISMPHRMTRTP